MAVEKLEQLQQQDDSQKIAEGIKRLDRATRNFAAKRMDNSIKQALAGHSVEQFTE